MTDHVCVPLFNNGQVVGHALASPDLSEEEQRALGALVVAAKRLMAERDAADPEAAAERARRQAEGIARIRERTLRRRSAE